MRTYGLGGIDFCILGMMDLNSTQVLKFRAPIFWKEKTVLADQLKLGTMCGVVFTPSRLIH